MIANHEINLVDVHSVQSIDLVHVRYGTSIDDREFTALITATAIDCYIHDETKKLIRGDRTAETFQEFWTFQFIRNGWYLREIEQTKESDIMHEPNDVSGLPGDASVDAPPPLPEADSSVGRMSRLLDSLGQTDRLWRRSAIVTAARNIYTNVCLTRESSSTLDVKTSEVTLRFADHLREELRQRERDGVRIEFRNFCVRKIQVVLVTPADKGKPAQFTARITAHALKIERRGEEFVSEDPYLRAFTDCCVFTREDGIWKLDNVLPTIGFNEELFTSQQ